VALGSIRFAPPLVISEEDLDKAIKILAHALNDLDKVSFCFSFTATRRDID
jgi:acetylornithine/succinyldiaminopimelate/putrescine aminotransferase